MLHTELADKIKTQTSVVREVDIFVSAEEYLKLEKQMINQTSNDDVHILSMNYNVTTGELKIKRQYFKNKKSFFGW